MKKEVTLVPKGKNPLSILAEMGDRTKDAWIFLHQGVANELRRDSNGYEELASSMIRLRMNATEEFPSRSITIETEGFGAWNRVRIIEADDIAFNYESLDPEEIIFIKMDD